MNNSALKGLMEPIDISSDSDVEITDVGESLALSSKRTSTNSRVLPSWASTAATSSRNAGYMYNNSSKKLQSQPGSSYSIGGLDQPTSTADGLYLTSNGYFGEPRRVNPWIANVSGTDYENLSSQQAFKRALPTSIQPSPHGAGSYFSEGASSSQSNNVYGSMFHSGGPGLSNNYRAYLGEHNNWSNDDDPIIVHERNGSRILPPSLMPRKSALSGSSAITIDSVPRSLGGDERAVGNDERIIFQAALQDLYQPKLEADVPDGLLSVSLLKHQKIALAWMLQRETRSLHCLGGILADDQGLGKTISMIALIQMQKSLDSSSKLEDNDKKTEALNLDEDEDKKLEALNLDEDDDNGGTAPDKPNQAGESGDTKQDKQVTTSKKKFSGRRPSAGTLVVCPASILRQWAGELDDKVAAEAKLSVLIYHGGSRTKDPVELAKYDVVLTTYAIVNNEVPKQPLVDEDDLEGNIGDNGLTSEFSFSKKQKKVKNVSKKRKMGKKGIDAYTVDSGTLARVGWSRVILDEAQTIKNHRTQVARACCSLRAKRRWCLSGTPIQNTIDDLYSYFRFLRYEPYNVYKSFYNTIKVPISKNSITGYKKLQVVLKGILLRRTKGTLINGEPIINLPPKSVSLNKVHFSDKERAFYTWLEAESRSKFKAYAAAGTVKLNYANILLMLLRLRQACDHPVLVNGISSASVGKISAEMAKKIPKDRVVELLNHLAASSAICCVCSDPPEDPVVTMCGHVFCYQCVSEQFTGDDNECPAPNCKEQLGPNVVFSEATLRSCAASDDVDANLTPSELEEPPMVWQRDFSSSKVQALLNILMSDCAENGPNSKLNDHGESDSASRAFSNYPTDGPRKSIIFSQWTGMLDLVEDALKLYYIEFRRLDGTMSLPARDKAVKDFNTDPEVSVMLMSLKAGNLGLNMVAACHVILLDLWWNPTTEDQAVDRAHRIGQTRAVTVTRLTVKDTVEDRILALQEEKRKMVASAFGEDQSGGSATRLTLQDLRYLFNVNND